MSQTYRLSERASAESLDIYMFGVEHFGIHQASAYLDGLADCFALLADNPRMGRAAERLGKGFAGMSMAAMSSFIAWKKKVFSSWPSSTGEAYKLWSCEKQLEPADAVISVRNPTLTKQPSHALFRAKSRRV